MARKPTMGMGVPKGLPVGTTKGGAPGKPMPTMAKAAPPMGKGSKGKPFGR